MNLTYKCCVLSTICLIVGFVQAATIHEDTLNSTSITPLKDKPLNGQADMKPINSTKPIEYITTPSPDNEDWAMKPECRKNSDCPFNHCCTVGMMRYTFPSCASYGNIDDPCIPKSVPKNFSLNYPNLKSIQVSQAYLMFCPCGSTLICDRASSTCQSNQNSKHGHNDLLDY